MVKFTIKNIKYKKNFSFLFEEKTNQSLKTKFREKFVFNNSDIFDDYKFIQPLKKKEAEMRHFIAADLETVVINDIHHVYAAAFLASFDVLNKDLDPKLKKKIIHFFATENQLDDLEKESLIVLHKFFDGLVKHIKNYFVINPVKEKNPKFVVYFHNLGSFDGIFVLKELINLKKFKKNTIIIRHNSIYQIQFVIEEPLLGKITLLFQDSYKMLPLKLDTLAKDLLENQGKLDIDHTKITLDYLKEKKNQAILLNYLKQDVFILYKIIAKVKKTLFQEFQINFLDSITIASLAFKLWRKNYYPRLHKKQTVVYKSTARNAHYHFLMESYRGGITEVYKPYGKNLFYYDINSSYPYAMLKAMPVGEPQFLPEISSLNIKTFFGFLEVLVEVPQETQIPLIGIKTGENLIYPTGIFKIIIFSEELKCALKYGTKLLKVYQALEFQKGFIFQNYVYELYKKKKNSTNASSKLIFKLLLNSLYGRFGMKKEVNKTIILPSEEAEALHTIYPVFLAVDTQANYTITTLVSTPDHEMYSKVVEDPQVPLNIKKQVTEIYNKFFIQDQKQNIATQIASAIAAYARIQIHEIKMDILARHGVVYYSDTDSVVTNIELPTSGLIGRLKLEEEIKEGIFVAAKAYWLLLQNGKIKKIFKGLPFDEKTRKLTKNIFLSVLRKSPKSYAIEYTKPVSKNFKQLTIEKQSINYQTDWLLKKRIKIYDKTGEHWIDTKPIHLEKLTGV